jgi:hypothetical protein
MNYQTEQDYPAVLFLNYQTEEGCPAVLFLYDSLEDYVRYEKCGFNYSVDPFFIKMRQLHLFIGELKQVYGDLCKTLTSNLLYELEKDIRSIVASVGLNLDNVKRDFERKIPAYKIYALNRSSPLMFPGQKQKGKDLYKIVLNTYGRVIQSINS